VRACRDVRRRFGSAPPRHQVGACSLRMRSPVSCPSLRQERRIQRDCKRRRTFSTGWQQSVDNKPFPRLHGRGSSPPGPPVGEALARTSAPSKMVAGSSMEGTSGAADRGLLRGRARDAALDPGCVRASDAFAPRRFVRVARLYTGALGRRPRASGSPRVCELLPFAGVALVGWDRPQRSSRTGSAPGNVGVSSRRCRDLTTRGVRADRVGIKLSHRRPKGWPRAEAPAAKAAGLLARENSTGCRPRSRMGSRPRPAKVLDRPQGLLGAGEAAPPVSGAGA